METILDLPLKGMRIQVSFDDQGKIRGWSSPRPLTPREQVELFSAVEKKKESIFDPLDI